MNIKIEIPSGAQAVISRLESYGFRADIVGGCVRDALLGRIADDFDITTSATPDEMLRIFSDMRVIKTGIAHGTVTVIAEGRPYEVTTYRIDGSYTDSRHPDNVEFTASIEEDLARRDFTVNAMAYGQRNGLTDLFGGAADIEARVIRAVGSPERRFTEDALRILRALRFASVLSFDIEDETANAIHLCRGLLNNVSCERILTEWRKLIGGACAARILTDFGDVISVFLPELAGCVPPRCAEFDAATAQVRTISLFALSQGDDAAGAFYSASVRLKADRHSREIGKRVLECLDAPIGRRADLARLLWREGEECVRVLIAVRRVLGTADASHASAVEQILNDGTVYRISDLAVGGDDLVALGLRGKQIGEALERLLLLVIEGEASNERAELLSHLSELAD